MEQIHLVLGQAGTGKTTWIMERVKELASQFLTAEYHNILAITRMHGARRRIKMKLRESCPRINSVVTTVDGFALSILNRWRTSLGYTQKIYSVSGDAPFIDSIFGKDADFGRVLDSATRLLQSSTVGRIIGSTYPLILIDEFQDCHGLHLDFIKVLSKWSRCLIIAADDFQLLDDSVVGCPAIEWAKSFQDDGITQITELTTCHRTSNKSILDAARCLRDNAKASEPNIPIICCPNAGPAAWKIIDALVFHFYSEPWTGTTALICPSHDPFLYKVLDSCTNQLKKRNYEPIRWHEECGIEEESKSIRVNLGITMSTVTDASCTQWYKPSTPLEPIGINIIDRAQKFARLRGLQFVSHQLMARYIDLAIHDKRAYYEYCPSRTITTVHGAKNREFDNVFILWTFKLPPNPEQQRRWLYNAVTRSRKRCMLLVLGEIDRVQNDPVLSLLGQAQPAFPNKRKAKTRSCPKKKGRHT